MQYVLTFVVSFIILYLLRMNSLPEVPWGISDTIGDSGVSLVATFCLVPLLLLLAKVYR